MSRYSRETPKTPVEEAERKYPYRRGSVGLLTMLTTITGREKIAEYGEEQNGSYIYDGKYLVEFTGDIALLVEYHGEERYGYCDTCGGTTPAYVEYAILAKECLSNDYYKYF